MRRRYAVVCTYDDRILRRFWRVESAMAAFDRMTAAPANPRLFDLRKIR